MSASRVVEEDWNFRVFEKRLVIVKTKNVNVRKVAVLDVLTDVMFAIEVPGEIAIEELGVEKEYLANLKVFTEKNLSGVGEDFVSFFEELDVDQSIEDFIKVYWIYPGKIRFVLTEVEES
jgi:hypothetical protein